MYGLIIPAHMLQDEDMANKYTLLVNRIGTMDKLLEMYDSE